MKYVSLHNHSSLSLYDGLGYPADFYKYVIEQGGDGLAITEHGSMNSLGYALTAAQALKNKGVAFRPIYGVEAYILPSLADWRKAYNHEDVENALVIEDENESKARFYDPVKRRHHLVITALNNKGLQNLFTLVSLSYRRECFYRFPRMDFEMLRQYSDGLAISTACVHPQTLVSTEKEVLEIQEIADRMALGESFFVLTLNEKSLQLEYKPIRWCSKTKTGQRLVRVNLADGRTVVCTPDHLFLTDSGWKKAQDLSRADRVKSKICKQNKIY